MSLLYQLDGWTLLRTLAAFAFAALLIPLSLPIANRLGLYDIPGGRKQHELPTPYVGGAVILVAILLSMLIFDRYLTTANLVFCLCSAGLVVVGLADDRYDLSWRLRIGVQVLVTLGMIFYANARVQNLDDVFGIPNLYLGWWVSVPFTIFIAVGVINALNMIDGSDGLAGGQVLISVLLFAAFALYGGNIVTAERLLAVAGAVAGFLLWNARFPWQPRARVFLGNAGSMLLGFIIAWTSVRLTQNAAHPVSPVLGPWTIAFPLIDCVTLMFRRVRQGRSPFSADRDHMHHLLLDAGYSPSQIAWGLAGLSLLLGLAAGMAVKMGVYRPSLVVTFLLAIAAYYWFSSKRERAVTFLERCRLRFLPGKPNPRLI
ncbi:MraY family glycosyltransferase [Arenimonas oryziterrae]|nr:MraY family glycosyltransferase [Arenimonas oryziterrae]